MGPTKFPSPTPVPEEVYGEGCLILYIQLCPFTLPSRSFAEHLLYTQLCSGF